MAEPRWVERVVVDAIHLGQIREHGGLRGVRDENALESALARPRHKWQYDEVADLPALAAAYGFGLCRNHPYRDGNKRVAFVVMVVFLELNGLVFDATEAEVVTTMLALADSRLSESDLAEWLRGHTRRKRRGRGAV
ncbi:MAG TPA: type II toxin-antitoxin system death-on-curing family toxin [Gemmatimonadales bacterium]|nr:type II toxin-antitoxin system death-on-curing family toxin [Gemmatimonadales bacterium]